MSEMLAIDSSTVFFGITLFEKITYFLGLTWKNMGEILAIFILQGVPL